MAIEIIPKKIEEKPSGSNIFLYFSLILLIIAVSAYFTLIYLEKKSSATLLNIKELIAQKDTPEAISLEKELIEYKKKIENVSFLLENHHKNSAFFAFLEKKTHPKVYFSKLDLNSKDLKAEISGSAQSFQSLGQQIYIFEKENLITSVKLLSASIGKDGKINFSLGLVLDPKIFKFQ